MSKSKMKSDGLNLGEIWKLELEDSMDKHKPYFEEADKYLEIWKDEYNNEAISLTGDLDFTTKRRYNIFWSNTETLKPLIFSALPKPNITRRFFDKGVETRIAATIMERCLMSFLDAPEIYNILEDVRDSYLVAGRGVVRVTYNPEEVIDVDGEEELDESTKKIGLEYVDHKDFLMSAEKSWDKVRWIAFRHLMNKDQVRRKWSSKVANKVNYNLTSNEDLSKKNKDKDNLGIFDFAEIWELWDKESKQVYYLSLTSDKIILDQIDDPFNLEGFFPTPMPLGSKSNINSLIPIPRYRLYKSQAEQLNLVDYRIKKLIDQLKATGVYSSLAEGEDIENIMNGEDGEWNPMKAPNLEKPLQSYLYPKPLGEIINTVTQLQVHKQEIIANIRDITGLSDIIRGTTHHRESATAQKIKGEFGISRIQPSQKEYQEYVKDLLALVVELKVENYSAEELVQKSNLEVVDIEAAKAELEREADALLLQAEVKTPEEAQQLKQQKETFMANNLKPLEDKLKGFAVTPQQLEEITELLKDDKMRSFLLDIETDSTIRADQSQEKQDRQEFVQVLSGMSQAVVPLLQTGSVTPDAVKELLWFTIRPYKIGRNLEGLLFETEPEPQGPSQEEVSMQKEDERKDFEVQLKAKEVDIKQQLANVEKAKVKADMQKHDDSIESEDVNKEADRMSSLKLAEIQTQHKKESENGDKKEGDK